jgi:hypothetical protein
MMVASKQRHTSGFQASICVIKDFNDRMSIHLLCNGCTPRPNAVTPSNFAVISHELLAAGWWTGGFDKMGN